MHPTSIRQQFPTLGQGEVKVSEAEQLVRLKQYRITQRAEDAANASGSSHLEGQGNATRFRARARIMEFSVSIGKYTLTLVALNLEGKADENSKVIGGGGYGQILKDIIQGKEMIIKRLAYDGSLQSLRQILEEYAIYKLCAYFHIGPEVPSGPSMDLVCYENAVEFFMEWCVPYGSKDFIQSKEKLQQCETDIRQAVKKLHAEGIVHLDIKPPNILYSTQSSKYLLTDFGISTHTHTKPGQKSLITYRGTTGFVSPEMASLRNSRQPGLVDLYANDEWALERTLDHIKMSTYGWSESALNPIKPSTEQQAYPNQPSSPDQEGKLGERSRNFKQNKEAKPSSDAFEKSSNTAKSVPYAKGNGFPVVKYHKFEQNYEGYDQPVRQQIEEVSRVIHKSSSTGMVGGQVNDNSEWKNIRKQQEGYVQCESHVDMKYNVYLLLFLLYECQPTPREVFSRFGNRQRHILFRKIAATGSFDRVDLQRMFDQVDSQRESEQASERQPIRKQHPSIDAEYHQRLLDSVVKKQRAGISTSPSEQLTDQTRKFYRRGMSSKEYMAMTQAPPCTSEQGLTEGGSNWKGLLEFFSKHLYVSEQSRSELLNLVRSLGNVKLAFLNRLTQTMAAQGAQFEKKALLRRQRFPYPMEMCLFLIAFSRFRSYALHGSMVQFCSYMLQLALAIPRRVDAAGVLFQRSVLHSRVSAWEDSLKDLREALELVESDSDPVATALQLIILQALMKIYSNVGEAKLYSQTLRRSHLSAPTHPNACDDIDHSTIKARALFNQRCFRDCETVLQQVKARPSESKRRRLLTLLERYYLLAYSHLHQGRPDQAWGLAEKISHLPKTNDAAVQQMARAFLLLQIQILAKLSNFAPMFQALIRAQKLIGTIDRQFDKRVLYLQSHIYNKFRLAFDFGTIPDRFRTPLLFLEGGYSKHLAGQRNQALELILESVKCFQDHAAANELFLLKLQYTMLTVAGLFFSMKLYEECLALTHVLSSDSFLPSELRILCDCLVAYCYSRLSKRVLAYRYSVKVVNEWKQLPSTHLRNGHVCLVIAQQYQHSMHYKLSDTVKQQLGSTADRLSKLQLRQLARFRQNRNKRCRASSLADLSAPELRQRQEMIRK